MEDEILCLPNIDDTSGIERWCKGYLMATRLDKVWQADDLGVTLVLPFGVLAKEFDLTGEIDADGNVIDDPAQRMDWYLNSLEEIVYAIDDYWAERRETILEIVQKPLKSTAYKIGRNEKCPCGSGLKYKKCCLPHERDFATGDIRDR